jgi:hypothetical protein
MMQYSSARASNDLRTLPPLEQRIADGRPIMTKEQLVALGRRVLQMCTMSDMHVEVVHTAAVVTRMADNRVLSSDDGDTLSIKFGVKQFPSGVGFTTNQFDDATLLAGVQRCETLLHSFPWMERETWARHEAHIQESIPAGRLWHDGTIRAMTTTRETVIPQLLQTVADAQLRAAGFLGFLARAKAYVSKADNLIAYAEETDSEVTVTARTPDGRRSGWGGRAARDWTTIDPRLAAQEAIRMATLIPGPLVAVEPGRRTAILAPTAVVQLLRFLAWQLDADPTDGGRTGFSKGPAPVWGNKLRQRVFDPRINISSSPDDPEGGFFPYLGQGHIAPAMQWIKNGILVNLRYDVNYGLARGKPFSAPANSFRVEVAETTPTRSVEEMIASCKDGIYVNRFSDVSNVHSQSGLMTGVTRDGCFLVRDGKITKAVKNFRILESPFFFLNRIEACSRSERAAFGYTPIARGEYAEGIWPRPPVVVPSLMIRDFNFSALVDAV